MNRSIYELEQQMHTEVVRRQAAAARMRRATQPGLRPENAPGRTLLQVGRLTLVWKTH